MNGLFDVVYERARQVRDKGFDAKHDDRMNGKDELTLAAAVYALRAGLGPDCGAPPPSWWPWPPAAFRPTDSRRAMVKAAALLLAAIEQHDRREKQQESRQ